MNRWQISSKIRLACDSLEKEPLTPEEYQQALSIIELSLELLSRRLINRAPSTVPPEKTLTDAEVESHASVKCGGLRGEAGIMARELLALRKQLKSDI
ncbi:hypothetical protein EHZ41_22600 [Salmonella enterica]|nr:hypothetical protein [Salmonella enterica]